MRAFYLLTKECGFLDSLTVLGFEAVRDFSPCFAIPRWKKLKIVQSLQNTKHPYALRPDVVARFFDHFQLVIKYNSFRNNLKKLSFASLSFHGECPHFSKRIILKSTNLANNGFSTPSIGCES